MWAARTEATHSSGEMSGAKPAGSCRSAQSNVSYRHVWSWAELSLQERFFEPCIVGVLAQQLLTQIKMVSGFWDADGRQHEWIGSAIRIGQARE